LSPLKYYYILKVFICQQKYTQRKPPGETGGNVGTFFKGNIEMTLYYKQYIMARKAPHLLRHG
jgi:hypothetical protein